MTPKDYDTTVARIAGNIAGAIYRNGHQPEYVASESVWIARAIVAEVKRTEPAAV